MSILVLLDSLLKLLFFTMPKSKLPLFGLNVSAFAMFLILILFPVACLATATFQNQDCGSVFCGNLNISYPFRLKPQPPNCGFNNFELECENNNRTTLTRKNGKFSVKEINYESQTMRVVDTKLENVGCSSLPLTLSTPYLTFDPPSVCTFAFLDYIHSVSFMYLMNCTRAMKSSVYVEASRCGNSSSSRSSSYLYFLDGHIRPSHMNESCTVEAENIPIMINKRTIAGMSMVDIYNNLSMGFVLEWGYIHCDPDILISFQYSILYGLVTYVGCFISFVTGGQFYVKEATCILCVGITGFAMLLRVLLGMPLLIALITYKLRRRHLCADDTIEEFLQSQSNLMPIRYSYNKIKKMTGGFKDKLGAGGFGSVFKGKLRSGHLVAVKLLDNSKANGQDFIAEVATIGRIHHVNVAKLIGFCVEGSKQALIYDFMPNGSLDRIIFAKENMITLSWQKMFDIALGAARGIEYLHQGCDMQILHFDIKPHNILLDENFIPKISDFGLAKLYSTDKNIVSLTAARGTIGYIAPELVYKNLGGVSHKADVYSFGMLLMEMVGKRKNLNAFTEHSSKIYFPSWIYNRVQKGEDIELEEVTDEEKIVVRKMIIVAFWCIRLKPDDRPSMRKVLEMLESDVKLLEMPPEPFQLPFEVSKEDNSAHDHANAEDPTTSLVSTSEISLEIE